MKKEAVDHLGFKISYNYPPRKIISLVPSLTELLFDLGLEKKIIGITKFCIHPADKVANVSKMGGTKDFNIKKILDAMPDLVIANKEENVEAGIMELKKHVPVWVCEVDTINGLLKMIHDFGIITGTEAEAEKIIREISRGFECIKPVEDASVAYLIWQNPYMAVGEATFINHLLGILGFKNIFSDLKRYPIVTQEDIRKAKPDYLFLSTEPYPFKEKHVKELSLILPESKVILVDGEMFSWCGSRIRYLPEYFHMMANRYKI